MMLILTASGEKCGLTVYQYRGDLRIVHNDAAGLAPNTICTVIKRIGAFQAGAASTRVLGFDRLQGCRPVEKLYALLLTGLAGNLNGCVTAALTDLPEPDQEDD